MKAFRFLISYMLLFTIIQAHGEEKPQATYEFDGYAVSDSLEYGGESIEYDYDRNSVTMTGDAFLSYSGRYLKSHKITFYRDYSYLEAVGSVDSTGVPTETPIFTEESGEDLYGTVIKYNLLSRQGYIQRGRTQYENGFMAADVIKRADDDTLYVSNGTYTTCDIIDHPHFCFAGKKMKFIQNDKLIIKPVVGYLHDIPVFWFPFYVFPIKKGRQSGFLTPRYGSSRVDGRFLSNLGYYYAPSDYYDYKGAGELRERNGWLFKNWLNYNVRDKISGSVYGSFENQSQSDSREWKLRMSHSQTVSPTLSISGNGQFESSKFSQYNSRNMYERMNRNMRSSMAIRKLWRESGNSLNTTVTYNKNLDTKTTQTGLPSISFRAARKRLFGSDDKDTDRRKYVVIETQDTVKPKWYESIYYSYNAKMDNRENSSEDKTTFTRDINLTSSLSSSNTLRGWLVMEPSLSLTEDFSATNKVEAAERYERNDNLSMNLRFGTTTYGMFEPKIGSIFAIRHVLNPSVTYTNSKRRSFSDDDMEAYYHLGENDLENSTGRNMTVNIRNMFQAKAMKNDEEVKIDLFTLNFASGFDFEDDEKPLKNLNTTLDLKPKKGLTTRLTARHSFYNGNNELDLFSPYLDDLTVTTTVGMEQRNSFTGTSRRDTANSSLDSDSFDTEKSIGDDEEGEAPSQNAGIPIKINFSHTYGIRRRAIPRAKDDYDVTHYLKPRISFSPTSSISINYTCNYDIEKQEMVFQRMVVKRDLHCWEANLSWVPSGRQEGFYFIVNIKDLPDVKLEKRRGSSRMSY